MTEVRRRFEVVGEDERKFTVIEFATFRWERNAVGERCRIENEGRDLFTTGGYLLIPTAKPRTYWIPLLGLEVHEVAAADTLQNASGVRRRSQPA